MSPQSLLPIPRLLPPSRHSPHATISPLPLPSSQATFYVVVFPPPPPHHSSQAIFLLAAAHAPLPASSHSPGLGHPVRCERLIQRALAVTLEQACHFGCHRRSLEKGSTPHCAWSPSPGEQYEAGSSTQEKNTAWEGEGEMRHGRKEEGEGRGKGGHRGKSLMYCMNWAPPTLRPALHLTAKSALVCGFLF